MNELSLVEFAENPEARCPCTLLVDTSASMHGTPIQELNEGLRTFRVALEQDELAARRVEVSIISYGAGGVRTIQDFITADDFQPPHLEAGGLTPMGEAIELALNSMEARKKIYKSNAIQYYRPWVFLITDGQPTDNVDIARARIGQGEKNQEFAFFAVGVHGADMDTLNSLCVRQAIKLKGMEFREMFQWLSQSLVSVSHSKPGEQTPLQPPGWGEV